MELKLSINSKIKASPAHMVWAYPNPDDLSLKVQIKPMLNGEMANYAAASESAQRIDFRSIVKDKVVAIEGLNVTYSDGETGEIKTGEELVSMPRDNALEAVFMQIALCVLNSSRLTEDEEKN